MTDPTYSPNPPSKDRVPFGAWWTLAVLLSLYILSFVDRNALAMLVEPVKADLGLTDTQVSLLLGPAFTLTYAIFGLPLGWAADRAPRRWVIFIGVVAWSACAVATGLARSFLPMFAARSGVGIGEAALSPSAYSLLADKFPSHRLALALSIYQGGIYLGQAAAIALVAVVLAHAEWLAGAVPGMSDLAPWRMAIILTGAPGMVFALLVFTFSEPPRRSEASAKNAPAAPGFWAFVKENMTLITLLMIGFGLVSMCGIALGAWTPTYLERRFAMEPAEYAPFLSMISLAGGATLLVKGGLMDWLYGRGQRDIHVRLYTWFLLGTSPAVYLIYLASSPALFFVLYAVVLIVTIPFMVFLIPAVQIFTPQAFRARMAATFLCGVTVIGSLGPVLVGLITDRILGDPAQLGVALAVVIGTALPITFVTLRLAMPHLRKVM